MAGESFWERRQILLKGQTAPLIEIAFMKPDLQQAYKLGGYAAWTNFWYVGAVAPHASGQGYILDDLNGVTRYEPDGTELPSTGNLIFQTEIFYPGSNDQSVEEWATTTSPAFKVLVLDTAP